MSSLKVLLVGGGITSALIGSLLKKSKLACHITAWDKARGAGGRMSTTRSPTDSNCTADLGAQYITALPKYLQSHNDFYNALLMSKIFEPLSSKVDGMKEFPEGTKHFVAPKGVSSVVKHLLADSSLQVVFEQHVSEIDLQPDNKWLVKTKAGREELFDVVVLTMPVPQILQLPGGIKKIADADKCKALEDNLKQVTYSSRYALGLFYNATDSLPVTEWDAKYLWDHDTFRYVSIDNKKRSQAHTPTAVVFHTSIDFGREYVDWSLDEVQPILMQKVEALFPNWPKPASIKCHKWRYSQVLQPYEGAPGCVVLKTSPLLLAAGDGFSHSNFDGCVESALSATATVSEFITAKSILK